MKMLRGTYTSARPAADSITAKFFALPGPPPPPPPGPGRVECLCVTRPVSVDASSGSASLTAGPLAAADGGCGRLRLGFESGSGVALVPPAGDCFLWVGNVVDSRGEEETGAADEVRRAPSLGWANSSGLIDQLSALRSVGPERTDAAL
jgi:hypothetical protein